jgi:hypothetical protein
MTPSANEYRLTPFYDRKGEATRPGAAHCHQRLSFYSPSHYCRSSKPGPSHQPSAEGRHSC